jgi:osmoprotectant transport system ATP-binding protein
MHYSFLLIDSQPQRGSVSNTSGATIELSNVSKVYASQKEPAVENFHMKINPGELVMLVGPSGCGKTTTMKMINRIIEPSSGSITIDGEDILSLDQNILRRRIGYVIQQIGLFPHMTIAENVAVVPKLLGWSKEKTRNRVNEMLELVELDPGQFAGRYPKQLSGGQQQRVGVARALSADPPVMLMDEPFGATDPITREKLQAEFLKLQASIGKTIVFVTHDFEEAIKLGDRIAVLSKRSKIEQFDTPANILANPASDYVSSFIGEGAALKRLALLSVSNASESGSSSSDFKLDGHDNLRKALDAIVLNGGAPVSIQGGGRVSIQSISAALGVDVSKLGTKQ